MKLNKSFKLAKRDITEAKAEADKAKSEAETLKYKAEIHIREAREEIKRAQSEAFKSHDQFEYRESKDKWECLKCKYVFKNRHHLSDHKLLQCISSTRESIGKKEGKCLYRDLPVTSSEFVKHTKVKVACQWSSFVLKRPVRGLVTRHF